MKKNSKVWLTLLALTLAACGGDDIGGIDEGQGETEAADGDFELDEADDNTLMIGMTNAPDSFNPFNRQGTATLWIQRFFYDSLMHHPEPGEFEPLLASSFDTEDNEVFTIEIQPDAYWSDGEPVTADDVAFTLNYLAHPEVESSGNNYISMIEGTNDAGVLEEGLDGLTGVEVVDDKTLTLTTKNPIDLTLMHEFVGFNLLIAPQHVFEPIEPLDIASSDEAVQPEVFSGAYQFIEYAEGDYVHLEANPDYHRGAPNIDTIYARIMNGTALVTEFQAGNLHMNAGGGIGMPPITDISLLEDVEGLIVEEHPSIGGQYFMVNVERFPDIEVRRAMALAMDFDSTVENLLDGHGETLAAPYMSINPYQHETLEPYPYDPEQARQLLDEVDFDLSEPLHYGVPVGNAVREQNGDLIEQWLIDVGFTINQQNYDFPTWLSMVNDLDYDIGLIGWPHTIDPDISGFFHSTDNTLGIDDPYVDELLAEGMAGLTFEERYETYAELQEYLQEQVYIIPLYAESDIELKVDYLEGGIGEFWTGSLSDLHEWSLETQD